MNLLAIFLILTPLNIASAFVIKCNYTTHPQYGYGCDALTIKCPTEDILCSSNPHDPNKENKDVLFFMASSEDFQSFPAGLVDHFPNLETINLNFPRLNHICNEDLKPFGSNLRNFAIQASEIEILPENLFKDTPSIRFIIFNSKNVKSIHKNTFEPLQSLNSMFMKLNCDGQEVDEDARSRADVENLITMLDHKCYDKNVPEPSPCKRKTNDGAGTDCNECSKPGTSIWIITGIVALVLCILILIVVIYMCYKRKTSASSRVTEPFMMNQNSR